MNTAPARHYRPWGELDDRELARLHRAHVPYREIAWRFSRSIAAVRNRVHILRLKREPRSAAWLRIFCRPHTMAGAARQMGTTIGVAAQTKHRLKRAGHGVLPALRGWPYNLRDRKKGG